MVALETQVKALPELVSGLNLPIKDDGGFILAIEQVFLGSCLIDTACFVKSRGIVEDFHFIEPIHKFIYQSMENSYEAYSSTTIKIIVNAADEQMREEFKKGSGIEWRNYLVRLAGNATTVAEGAEERARAVVEQWGRLTLCREVEKVFYAARDPLGNVRDLVSGAIRSLDEIGAMCRLGRVKGKTCRMIGKAMKDALGETREAMGRKGGLTGVSWGLVDLNRITGGIQKRDLTLVAARPSMGKTTFAVSVARNAARSGAGVGFISLEMDGNKIAQRLASDMAYDWNVHVPYVDIIRGAVSKEDLSSVEAALSDIDKLPLAIEEQSGLTVAQIRTKIENMMHDFERAGSRLDVVMIDHLGLIRASSRYSGNRNNEIAEMTASLKAMARDYDIAVVLLSQLNRDVEKRGDKRPQLSDLRDSGAIEQDADTIMFLYREAYYLERDRSGDFEERSARIDRQIDVENKMEIIMAKQRNGPLKTVDVFADMGCSAIRNWRKI